MNSVDTLAAFVAPPEVPIEVPSLEDWSRVEKSVGVRYPIDFKHLLSTFGSGNFDHFIFVLNPAARQSELDLGEYSTDVEMLLVLYKQRSRNTSKAARVERFLPVANTINGDELFYAVIDAEPAFVVLAESRGGDFEEFDLDLSALLLGLLNRSVRTHIFPANFPSSDPKFEKRIADVRPTGRIFNPPA